MSDKGLTEEERTQVLHAGASGLFNLLDGHPELRRIDGDDLTRVYVAGLSAGADALDRVLAIRARDL